MGRPMLHRDSRRSGWESARERVGEGWCVFLSASLPVSLWILLFAIAVIIGVFGGHWSLPIARPTPTPTSSHLPALRTLPMEGTLFGRWYDADADVVCWTFSANATNKFGDEMFCIPRAQTALPKP